MPAQARQGSAAATWGAVRRGLVVAFGKGERGRLEEIRVGPDIEATQRPEESAGVEAAGGIVRFAPRNSARVASPEEAA